MPRAADPASAAAAGASITSRGTGGSQPRRPAHARAKQVRATSQKRAAHSRRHSRPTKSGRAAATRISHSHPPVPYGPVANLSTWPRPSLPAGPGSTPINAARLAITVADHGMSSTNAAADAARDSPRSRALRIGRPVTADPASRPAPITGTM